MSQRLEEMARLGEMARWVKCYYLTTLGLT